MVVTASQKYIRISPQKLKFVADEVKKLSLMDMRKNLSYLNKEAARKLLATLDQALANAHHNYGLAPEQLKLESLLVLRGPQYKRLRARSRGMGHPILKRTSHIVIKLKSVDQKIEKEEKKVIGEVKNEAGVEKVEKKVEPKKASTKNVVKKTAKKMTKK